MKSSVCSVFTVDFFFYSLVAAGSSMKLSTSMELLSCWKSWEGKELC